MTHFLAISTRSRLSIFVENIIFPGSFTYAMGRRQPHAGRDGSFNSWWAPRYFQGTDPIFIDLVNRLVVERKQCSPTLVVGFEPDLSVNIIHWQPAHSSRVVGLGIERCYSNDRSKVTHVKYLWGVPL